MDQVRRLLIAGCAAMLVVPVARAQRAGKVARVGWLGWLGAPDAAPAVDPLQSLRGALRERGWIEGNNLAIEVRHGVRESGAALTQELVRARVDVIVAHGAMVFPARGAAGSTPLVFGINGDPVEAKLVASYSRPGGMLTGITALSGDFSGKRLELLKEAAPQITRVAAIANQSHAGVGSELEASQTAARRLGLSLQWLPVYAVKDFEGAFAAAVRERAQAIVGIPDTLINGQARPFAQFAAAQRLPTISGWSEFAEAGNLMSYGSSVRGFFRQLAVYTDKLLRGAKPADLPVEQPTEPELVVNLAAARAIGLKVPQATLLRANRTIDL